MFVLAAIPWELVGILGGTFCCGSFFLSVVSTLGIIIYRAQTGSTRDRRAASQPTLPAESPQTAELLTSVVGYRASGDQKRTRERWGRPVTYTRTPTEGAHWFTPANGIQLTLMERNGRPGGILTGTPSSMIDPAGDRHRGRRAHAPGPTCGSVCSHCPVSTSSAWSGRHLRRRPAEYARESAPPTISVAEGAPGRS